MFNDSIVGRFQEEFVENRRAALERCVLKMLYHPILRPDVILRKFLEDEQFPIEMVRILVF